MTMTRDSFYKSLGGVGTASSANVLAKLIEHKDQPRRVLGFDEKAKISSDDIATRVRDLRILFKEYASNNTTAIDIIKHVGTAQDSLKAKADNLLLRPSRSHQPYEAPSKEVKSVLSQDEICEVLRELKLEQYKDHEPDYAELLKLENRLNQLAGLITKEEIMQKDNAPCLFYLFSIILQDEHCVKYLNRNKNSSVTRNFIKKIITFHGEKDQLFKDCPKLHALSETQRFYLCCCFYYNILGQPNLPALFKENKYPYLEEAKCKFIEKNMQQYTQFLSTPEEVTANFGWRQKSDTERHVLYDAWRIQQLIEDGLRYFSNDDASLAYVEAIENTTIAHLETKQKELQARNDSSAQIRAGQIGDVIQQIRTNVHDTFYDHLAELRTHITEDKDQTSERNMYDEFTQKIQQNFKDKMKTLINTSEIGLHRNLIRPILKGALGVFLSIFTGFSLLFVKGYRKTFFWTDTARILHDSKKTTLTAMNNRRSG